MKIEVSCKGEKASFYIDNNFSKEILIEKTRELMISLPESDFYDVEFS